MLELTKPFDDWIKTDASIGWKTKIVAEVAAALQPSNFFGLAENNFTKWTDIFDTNSFKVALKKRLGSAPSDSQVAELLREEIKRKASSM